MAMIDSQTFNAQLISNELASYQLSSKAAYLFYGQSAFLSDESAQLLVNHAKKQGFTQRDIFYIEARTKFSPIKDSLQSMGLFDPKKIVELRLETTKPTKALGEALLSVVGLLENANNKQNNLLVIQAGELDKSVLKTAWFKKLSELCEVIHSASIYASTLPAWIQQRAKQRNLSLSSDAVRKIIDYSEGNITLTAQMLNQLSTGEYTETIDEKMIADLFSEHAIFKVNDLVYALLYKQKNALKIIQKLQAENESLILITATLYREFDLIGRLMNSHLPFAQACQQYRVWPSRQKWYQQAIRVQNTTNLQAIYQQLARLDRINKGQEDGDGWLLLSQIATDIVCHAK